MNRRNLERVIPQIGCCGIWCGSCVVGNGALMELARRYREMVESHGLEHWGAGGFDYAEFIRGLKSVSELDVCAGCLAGGGRDGCELRECVRERGLESCVACGEFPDCSHRELLKHMRSGALRAGLTVMDADADAERVRTNVESELRSKWWWRAVFEEQTAQGGRRARGGDRKEQELKYGARNRIHATVSSVKSGDVMSLVKFKVERPCSMASVLTTESVEELGLKVGDEVTLIVKAVHVLPVKE